ncbi:MAG TPA: TIGR01777 family protein [Anaerolineae bacterium]|nr:TIGR01777 family protein [Anaerolineae bacterium]
MKILISGGSGLIGRALTRSLLNDDHHVTVLSRNPTRSASILPKGVALQQWDGVSLGSWQHVVSESDAVIHLAGESIAGENLAAILTRRWTSKTKARILESRVQSGHVLLEAIRKAKRRPSIFIQASAVGYYGPRGTEEITEETSPGEGFLAQVCQKWEASIAELESMGVRRVVIRTGLVLSAEGGILPMMLLPFRFYMGGRLGDGLQGIPWIHIQDEVDAIRFLGISNHARGAYNLSAPHPVSDREFARIAGLVLHRPNIFLVPAFALKAVLGEKSMLVLDGQYAVPNRLIKAGYTFHYEQLEPALRQLLQS